MSSFTCPQLDRTATIKACNQLSKICEVMLTRLSRAEIEQYTRKSKDAEITYHLRSRKQEGQKWEHSNNHLSDDQVKCRRGRSRKYISDENLSDENNSHSFKSVEFVDCTVRLTKVNTGTVEKLNVQTPVSEADTVCNKLDSDLATGNTENICNSADVNRKRKSLKSPFDDDEICKRIKLDAYSKFYEESVTGEDTVTLPLCKIVDFENSFSGNTDIKKMAFGKETDVNHDKCLYMDSSGNRILHEKSSESCYKGMSNSMVFSSTEDLSYKPLPTVPLCFKSDDAGEEENVCYVPNDSDIKCKAEKQLEFSQTGLETTTELCVSVSDGIIYNRGENVNNQTITDTSLFSAVNSRNKNCSIPVALNSCSLNDTVQDVLNFRTPVLGVDEISKHKVLNTNFSTVISIGNTNSEQETHHSSLRSLVEQSVSENDKTETSKKGVVRATDSEEIISSNRVTDSDVRGYFTSVASQTNTEEKVLSLPALDDQSCIMVVDDDDDDSSIEVIDLTDSEEVINYDDASSNDGDEILPVNQNDNTGEEKLASSLLLDDNTRCSLNSNASEELVDLAADSGENVVVFDGASSVQLCGDEEPTKTYMNKNRLHSVDDSDAVCRGNKEVVDLTCDEVIIFDDVNTDEFTDTGVTKSTEKYCYFDEKVHTQSDLTTMCIAFDGSPSNKDSCINKVTTNSRISVDVRSGEEEHSSSNLNIGKIRVRDPSNLGIASSVPFENSSQKILDKNLNTEHVSAVMSPETDDMSIDLLITLYRDICNNGTFTDEERHILRSYKQYFNKTTEGIISEMGQVIHLAVCDNLNYLNYIEQVEKLLTEHTVTVEKKKAETLHKADMETRGNSFVKCLKEIVNKINIRDLQDMVFIVYCRSLDSFLRLAPVNKKHFRLARQVIREMLVKVNCDKYYKLEQVVYMDSYPFLRKYNTIIKLIQRYYDMIIRVKNYLKLKHTEDGINGKSEVGESQNGSGTLRKNLLLHKELVAMKPLPATGTEDGINRKAEVGESQNSSGTLVKSLLIHKEPIAVKPLPATGTISTDKRKQPLIRGVLLLNGEHMTRVSDLSLDELLLLNRKTFITVRQISFLQNYKKYFLGTTEDKLLKLGELLHVVSCEMQCQDRQLESIKELPHGGMKISEEAKIRAIYTNKLKQRGFDFIFLMKGITGKFHTKCVSRMVCAMYCRITEIFLKIDINNIKHFVSIREVVKKMLELNSYENIELFEVLTMKEDDFVKSYNSIIHVLLVYYELLKSVGSQKTVGSSVNNSGSAQGTTSNSTAEGNIVIPLSSRAVEVPIIKRDSKNSVVIV